MKKLRPCRKCLRIPDLGTACKCSQFVYRPGDIILLGDLATNPAARAANIQRTKQIVNRVRVGVRTDKNGIRKLSECVELSGYDFVIFIHEIAKRINPRGLAGLVVEYRK